MTCMLSVQKMETVYMTLLSVLSENKELRINACQACGIEGLTEKCSPSRANWGLGGG